MHFFGIDCTWWLIVLIGIGLYTIGQGGGWKEFLDNDMSFWGWQSRYSLHIFLFIICLVAVALVWLCLK